MSRVRQDADTLRQALETSWIPTGIAVPALEALARLVAAAETTPDEGYVDLLDAELTTSELVNMTPGASPVVEDASTDERQEQVVGGSGSSAAAVMEALRDLFDYVGSDWYYAPVELEERVRRLLAPHPVGMDGCADCARLTAERDGFEMALEDERARSTTIAAAEAAADTLVGKCAPPIEALCAVHADAKYIAPEVLTALMEARDALRAYARARGMLTGNEPAEDPL